MKYFDILFNNERLYFLENQFSSSRIHTYKQILHVIIQILGMFIAYTDWC